MYSILFGKLNVIIPKKLNVKMNVCMHEITKSKSISNFCHVQYLKYTTCRTCGRNVKWQRSTTGTLRLHQIKHGKNAGTNWIREITDPENDDKKRTSWSCWMTFFPQPNNFTSNRANRWVGRNDDDDLYISKCYNRQFQLLIHARRGWREVRYHIADHAEKFQ